MSVLFETNRGNLVLDVDFKNHARSSSLLLASAYINSWLLKPFDGFQKDVFLRSSKIEVAEEIRDLVEERGFEDAEEEIFASAGPGSVELVEEKDHFYIQINLGSSSFSSSKHVFGQVAEGIDVLDDVNNAQDGLTVLHAHVVYDPFGLSAKLPKRKNETDLTSETLQNTLSKPSNTESDSASVEALALELLGDLSHYKVKPSPETLFVARLNPITSENSLEVIFSRFGSVKKVQIVLGRKSKYAFVEFMSKSAAESAYAKLHDNCTIDGHQVLVDFSQSTKHRTQR